MNSPKSLAVLGPEIIRILHAQENLLLKDVIHNALGIRYHNFHKRAKENRLLMNEIAAIMVEAGIEIKISLGNAEFSNLTYEPVLAGEWAQLQAKYIEALEQIQALKKELEACQASQKE